VLYILTLLCCIYLYCCVIYILTLLCYIYLHCCVIYTYTTMFYILTLLCYIYAYTNLLYIYLHYCVIFYRKSWFSIDLGVWLIPSAYTLRHSRGYGKSALRNWLFQVSKDGVDWLTLKEHVNDTALNEPGYTGYALFSGIHIQYISVYTV